MRHTTALSQFAAAGPFPSFLGLHDHGIRHYVLAGALLSRAVGRPDFLRSQRRRVERILGLHYLSDVLIGIVIGMTIGIGVFVWLGL